MEKQASSHNIGLLTLLHFNLKDTLSVGEESHPAARIWLAVLQYLQACPGCRDLYQAKIAQAPDILELLVLWESAEDWRRLIFVLKAVAELTMSTDFKTV